MFGVLLSLYPQRLGEKGQEGSILAARAVAGLKWLVRRGLAQASPRHALPANPGPGLASALPQPTFVASNLNPAPAPPGPQGPCRPERGLA